MTLASLLYRASPVEHLRSVSAPYSRTELEKYGSPVSLDSRGASPLPAPTVSATEISRPSSTSTQASNAALVHQYQSSNQSIHSAPHNSTSFSLPGLSALASIASAPGSQLRYVKARRMVGIMFVGRGSRPFGPWPSRPIATHLGVEYSFD